MLNWPPWRKKVVQSVGPKSNQRAAVYTTRDHQSVKILLIKGKKRLIYVWYFPPYPKSVNRGQQSIQRSTSPTCYFPPIPCSCNSLNHIIQNCTGLLLPLYSPVLYSPVLYNHFLYSHVLYSPVLYSPVLYIPVLYSPVLHSPTTTTVLPLYTVQCTVLSGEWPGDFLPCHTFLR